MKYHVACFENVTHGDRFEEYRQPTSLLSYVGTFRIHASSAPEAAESAFEIGNTGSADADGQAWPRTRTSMSVGDVVLVDGVPMTVDHFGFVTLDSIQPDGYAYHRVKPAPFGNTRRD